jgi:hypothetical protein
MPQWAPILSVIGAMSDFQFAAVRRLVQGDGSLHRDGPYESVRFCARGSVWRPPTHNNCRQAQGDWLRGTLIRFPMAANWNHYA